MAVNVEGEVRAIRELGMTDYFYSNQVDWIIDESPMKICVKSRRVGFTYAASYRKVMKGFREDNLDCWWISRDEFTAKEFIRYCQIWVRLMNEEAAEEMGDGSIYLEDDDITVLGIKIPNGSRIMALSSNPNAAAGKGGDVTIDEFALHEKQDDLYDVAMPVITWGGQLEIISSQRGKTSTFNRFIEDIHLKGNPMKWSLHQCDVITAINNGFVERVNRVKALKKIKPMSRKEFLKDLRAKCRSEGAWQREYMCRPSENQEAVLSLDMIEKCIRPDRMLNKHQDWDFIWLGYDIGRKKHLAVIVALGQKNGQFSLIEMVEMPKWRFPAQKKKFMEIYDSMPADGAGVDGTGQGLQMAEDLQDEYGEHAVDCVMFSEQSKQKMASLMNKFFSTVNIFIPDDNDLKLDLHSVEEHITDKNHITYEAPEGDIGHADRFWAIALALLASGVGLGKPLGDAGHNDEEGSRDDPYNIQERDRVEDEQEQDNQELGGY